MISNKNTGRIAGVLLLLVFIIGILIYQFLRGPFLFAEDFLDNASLNSNQIINSVLLAFLSGVVSIIISILLLPIFKRYNSKLAFLYIAFCIVSFVAISFENYSALSLLEFSHQYVSNGGDNEMLFQSFGSIYYKNHEWSHNIYLLISCLPVFVLYYTLFCYELVPRIISGFGVLAAFLMFIGILLSIFKMNLNMNLMIPMALIQLFFPFWIIFKGFRYNEISDIK